LAPTTTAVAAAAGERACPGAARPAALARRLQHRALRLQREVQPEDGNSAAPKVVISTTRPPSISSRLPARSTIAWT
jgi:hypothetical protein